MSGRGTAEERSGWTDTDRCWWCGVARQTREHLFKECRTWEGEVRTLWKEVGEISQEKMSRQKDSRDSVEARRRRHIYNGKKGFGFGVRASRAGLGNTSIKDRLGKEGYTGAVVNFLMSTKVGEVKEGVIQR